MSRFKELINIDIIMKAQWIKNSFNIWSRQKSTEIFKELMRIIFIKIYKVYIYKIIETQIKN